MLSVSLNKSFPTIHNMLGSCRCIKTFYSAKYRSFHITLASFTSGYDHLKEDFNNLLPFLKQNYLIISDLKNVFLQNRKHYTDQPPIPNSVNYDLRLI